MGTALERNSESGELLRRPSDSHTQREAASGKPVKRSDFLREHQRVVFGHKAYSGCEPDFSCDGGGKGEGDKRIEPVGVGGKRKVALFGVGIFRIVPVEKHHMLSDPERGKSDAFGVLSRGAHDFRMRPRADTQSEESRLHLIISGRERALPSFRLLMRFDELEHEAIGLAAMGEDKPRAVIFAMPERARARLEIEARLLDLADHEVFVDSMEGRGVAIA